MRLRSSLVSLCVTVGFLLPGCAGEDSAGTGGGASSGGGDGDGTGDGGDGGSGDDGTGSEDDGGSGTGGGGSGDGTSSDDGNTTGTGTGGDSPIELDCASPPLGAVGAAYSHTPEVTGAGGATLAWSATGLPEGTGINQVTGEISGTPTTAGSYPVEITVMGPGVPPPTDTQTCDIEVNDQMTIDLSGLDPPCIDETTDILDYIAGGDGSDLICRKAPGSGNGKLPAGITVNETTCQIEGTNTDEYGLIAWIMEVEQSDLLVHVPYCMAQPTQEQGAYTITVDHGGDTGVTLEPAIGSFLPETALAYGGGGDPYFQVLGGCAPNACFYRFAYSVNSSPFDLGTVSLDPDALLTDAGTGDYLGLEHELSVSGPPVEEKFEERPWVQNVSIDYCIADATDICNCGPNDPPGCTNADKVRENGNGHLEFSIIMQPG